MKPRNEAKTLPPEELALFCRQTAMVLKSGIPLHDGMDTLAQSYAASQYAARFAAMRDHVAETGSLSAAMREAGVFPAYLVAMTGVGERAGKLEEVTESLARYYEWEKDVRSGVENAILYPTVLVCMLAVVIAILVTAVLPVFSRVFESLGLSAGTPSGTIMRLGIGFGRGVLAATGVLLLILLVLGILLRGNKREKTFDFLCRILPPVRRAMERLSAGRFASVVSTMLTAGFNLGGALELVPAVVTEKRYAARVEKCRAEMETGRSFSAASAEAGLFEPIHEKMVLFGEAAGQLDAVMAQLCVIYQSEADDAIRYLVSLIEPTLVTVLSVVIGGILLTVMLPLLSVLSAIA